MTFRDIDAIKIEIKNAWIRQIKQDWQGANYTYFKSKMFPPGNIDLLNSNSILGKWEGGTKRNLSLSIYLISQYSWEYVQEVLYHEMAHQYVEEILKITDEKPHGEAFRGICNEHGFDHQATGDIKDWAEKKKKNMHNCQNHKLLERVQKLFALAESPNPHEAELAMTKARELLLKHNLSLLELEADRKYVHKQIGKVEKKNPIKSLIVSIINKFFFVETIWVFGYDQYRNKRGRILEIYGTPENVEMAEYIHDYLHNISEKLWLDYKRQNKITRDKDRRTYIYGLLNGFHQKLSAQVTTDKTGNLVWKGDNLLKDYYRRRNPKIRKSTFSYSKSSQKAYNLGIAHGKNLIIHKGIKNRSSGEIHLLEYK